MAEKRPSRSRVDLPIPLNGFLNLTVLEAAQAYTLQLLEWAENGPNDGKDESTVKTEFLNWLRDFKAKERLDGSMTEFKSALRTAGRIMPYIKSDIHRLLRKGESSYSTTMAGDDADCDNFQKTEVCEADALLYDNVQVPLEKQGKGSEVQCLNCKSTNCSELEVEVDDSACLDSQAKLFTFLDKYWPICTADGSHALLIGSGIGSLAYGTFLFSTNDRAILSCEWDEKLCQLQEEVIKKHGMAGKVSVHNCICPDPGIVRASKLVVICTRVSTLKDKEVESLFLKLYENMTPGSVLVICKQGMSSYIDKLGDAVKGKLHEWVKLKWISSGQREQDSLDHDNFTPDFDDDDYKLKYYIYTVV